MNQISKKKYLNICKESLINSCSIFVVLLVCQLIVWLLDGKVTAFDSALSALLHYGKDSISILFLTTASLLLLALALFFEGAPVALLFRKYVAVPALNISGHMLSMAAGSTVGWYLIVSIENHFDFTVLLQIIFIYFASIIFSIMCLSAKPFFDTDLAQLKEEHGKAITVFTVLMGGIASVVMYFGYVYNFNPIGTGH
ncbi:hypothetical protein [Alteromonas stellipolaris]|uniref:hypothetical protein n=1 Tax=Alteromonas stellipolaris TaxID=233316 RepID=UPI000B18F029|nr:hypothetical protein [Alteromonas stellipolaris]